MSLNHQYLEAVQAGELSAVKHYLGLPDVDVNYLDVKLQSALHRSVTANRNSHQMVTVLIEAGIDCSLRDAQKELADDICRRLGRRDLTQLMVECEFRDVPVRDVFYELIRRSNMDMLQEYVHLKNLSVREMVQHTEVACEALRMKGVMISAEAQFEVEKILVNYYSENPTFAEIKVDKEDLLKYIDFVLENSDEDNLNETSNAVLMALRELVKLMYIGKQPADAAIKEVRYEVRYCLCAFVSAVEKMPDRVFVSAVEKKPDTFWYALVINKQMVLRYLRLVAKQIRHSEIDIDPRDRKVRRELRKTFVILKEVNSVHRIITYLKKARDIDLNQHDDRVANQLALDRCIQVVGEAIKSTKLSPNLSQQMKTALDYMISSGSAASYRNTREFHSHGYPVIKYLLEKEYDLISYRLLQHKLKCMFSFFECMYSTLQIFISKRFLGLLYSMKTIKQMRSLEMFIGEGVINIIGNPVAYTEMFYSEKLVMKLVNDLKILLKDDSLHHQALIKLEDLLKRHFETMSMQNDGHGILSESFELCLHITRHNDNIDSIRSVLKSSLLIPCPKYSISFCCKELNTISSHRQNLLSSLLMSGIYKDDHSVMITAMELFQQLESEYLFEPDIIQQKKANRASERYIEEILHECGVDEKVLKQISKTKLKNLSHSVFNVKEQFKILALPDSPKVRAFRKKQEDEFQAAFDRKIVTLNDLLNKLLKTWSPKPRSEGSEEENWTVWMAIEQVLLEICEILISLGIMKPNLHLLNLRVPVICGKNFRDGLAHDMLMYNVISASRISHVHVVCNAIYYAKLSIKIYEETESIPELISQDKCSETLDKLRWFSSLQSKLYDQLKNLETLELKQGQIDEPDVLGFRREKKSSPTIYGIGAIFQAIIYNVQSFVDHIDGTKRSRTIQRLINVLGGPLKMLNQLTNPEKVKLLQIITLKTDNFSLCRKITQNYNLSLTLDEAFEINPAVMNHLDELNLPPSERMLLVSIKTGNTEVFKKLLTKLDTKTIIACSPLTQALVFGQVEIAQLLVKIVEPNDMDIQMAIKFNFNDILKHKHVFNNVIDFNVMVQHAIHSDNLEAIKLMEKSSNCYRNIDGLVQVVVQLNRTSILKHFLLNDEWRNKIDELDKQGETAIEVSAHNGNYSAVKLLSQYATDKRAIARACFANHSNIVKYLLRCNDDLYTLFPDLRIELINQAIENKNNTLLEYHLGHPVGNNVDLSEQFLAAINWDNFDALEQLLKHDPQCAHAISHTYENNAFHLVALKGVMNSCIDKVFNLLVAHKVNPAAKTNAGRTPLFMATTFGNLKIISRLYELAPDTINQSDNFGRTPLINALIFGSLPIIEYLSEKNADPKALSAHILSYAPGDNTGPDVTYFLGRNPECLDYAINTLHVDPNLTNPSGGTMLHEFCLLDKAEMVAFLVERCNATIAAQDDNGETVLHHAVRYDSKAVLEYLLKRPDCDLNQPNAAGHTPLWLAMAIPDRLHMAQKLIDAGASADLTDSSSAILFLEFCRTDKADMVAFLVERCNANIAAQDNNGETVLHHAVRCDSKAVLKYLLTRSDCKLDQPDAQGRTPLWLAMAVPDRIHMAQKLVQAGASKEKLLQMIAWSCREALAHIQ